MDEPDTAGAQAAATLMIVAVACTLLWAVGSVAWAVGAWLFG